MEIESSLSESIRHRAVVTAVESGRGVSVRILDKDACDGCAAASLCHSASPDGSTEIFIETHDASRYHKGDTVEIEGTERLHRKAIRLVTVYPTLTVIAVMTGVYLLTANQLAAALSALAVMLLFFILLWIARGRLSREFAFRII